MDMMTHLLGLLFIFVFVPLGQLSTDAATQKKPLPYLKSRAYTAKLQIIIVDKGYTAFATEKSDWKQGKASLEMVKGDNTSLLLMDYYDSVIYNIEYSWSTKKVSKCQVASMKRKRGTRHGFASSFHIFGGKNSTSNIPHMFSTRSVFRMGYTNKFTYKGTATVDGIKADWWTSHMKWSDLNDDFTLNYYFTSSDWLSAESASKKSSYPLRIEIKGTKDNGGGNITKLHHYYEYLNFEPSDGLPTDAFSIPDGAVCEYLDDEKIKPVPKIPTQMSYEKEIIDEKGNVNIEYVDYDGEKGYMEIRSGKGSILYDFNDGIRYDFDTNSKCTARAITPGVDQNAKVNGYYVQDIGPGEFTGLNNTLVFDGPEKTRFLDSYSWSGNINDYPFDVHFAKLNWNYPGYSYNSTPPPLSMTRGGKQYNFFDFRPTSTVFSYSSNLQNARYCAKRAFGRFAITFHSQHGDVPRYTLFSTATSSKISSAVAKAAGVKPMQVDIQWGGTYEKDTQRLYLYIILLGPPAAQFLYRRSNHTAVQQSNSLSSKTMSVSGKNYDDTVSKSAKLCEGKALSGQFLCRNFDLCKNGDGSYKIIMYTTLPSTASIGHSSSCNHFARSVESKVDISYSKALANLKDAVKKGSVKVNIKYKSNYTSGVSSLAAFNITNQFNKFKSVTYDPTRAINKFKYQRSMTGVTKTEVINSVSSLGDCTTQCLARTEYECQAVEYCFSNKQCILSESAPKKSTSSRSRACTIVARDYTADFQIIPGKTLATKTKDSYQNVASPSDCAKKCVQTKKYTCESFDYCSSTKLCVLRKIHLYAATAAQVKNTSCTHYSKNYVLDFKVSKNTALVSNTNLETLMVTGAEQCAYLCRKGYSGQGCVQFDYCSKSQQCQIVSGNKQKTLKKVTKSGCDTYTLNNIKSAAMSSGQTSGSVTYSNSSFTGLAVAMIIIGLAFGALIIFVLRRKNVL